MQETALVSILTQLGITHRRAVAFERFMDDRAYVGINADSLASLFMVYGKRAVYEARQTKLWSEIHETLEEHDAACKALGKEVMKQT